MPRKVGFGLPIRPARSVVGRCSASVVVATVFAASTIVFAADVLTEAPSPERLVEQLADPDYRIREEAQRRLLELGSDARRPLEKAQASSDVEQRLRVLQILRELRRNDLWKSSYIDLERRSVPVLDVYRAIEEQTGNPINWTRTPKTLSQSVEVHWDNTPYWEAMDQLGGQGRVVANMYDDPMLSGAVLSHGENGSYPVSYHGPLRLRLVSARKALSQTLHFGDMSTDEQQFLNLTFALNWEQRFALCRYAARLLIADARTDAGEDLAVAARSETTLMPVARRQRQLVFSTQLRPCSKPASKIARLRIGLELVAAGDFQTLAVDELESAAIARDGGYELEILETKPLGNAWAVTLRWTRPQPYDKLNATDMVDEYLEVLDADGEAIPFVQHQVIGDKSAVQYVVHTPAKHGKPAKIRYHVATLHSPRLVEFNYADIPLPGEG